MYKTRDGLLEENKKLRKALLEVYNISGHLGFGVEITKDSGVQRLRSFASSVWYRCGYFLIHLLTHHRKK